MDCETKNRHKGKMICPICDGIMVMFRMRYSDDSGWMFGYLCDCTAELRESTKKEKVSG